MSATRNAPIDFNVQVERVNNPPWGLDGGLSAAGNEVAIQRAGQPEQRYPNGKVFDVHLDIIQALGKMRNIQFR